MENKYYTPSIEEFHVGFECEWQCKIRKETWNKQICDQDLVNIAYSTHEHADEEEPFSEQFRVKYLDSSDIESILFDKDKFLIRTSQQNNVIQVCRKVNSEYENNGNHYILFQGNIKNKSELSRLLKQLSII